MLGLILTILVIIILLAGVIYYVSIRNNEMNDKYVNSLTKYDNFKKNAFGHITNSLKEIDYLNRKTGSLGSNKDSTCYRSKGNKIKGCECHNSCSTCGYSNSPNGINQCLTCKNGNKVNSLYNNGAGWCGSFNENGEIISSSPSIDSTFSKNEASVNTNSATTNTADESSSREMTCNERFARMCASSSDWTECLEKNKKSLVLAGCNIQLESNKGSSSASSGSASGSASGSSSSGSAANTGMIKKDFLKVGEKMLANEYLQSANSKFKFLIENNGQLIIKHNNGTQKWSAQRTSLSTINGPYYILFNSSFNLILYDKTNREVWKAIPNEPFSPGVNVKVLLDDNGILQILDNGGNKKWDSPTYTASLNSGNTGSSSSTSNANNVPTNAQTKTTLSVFGYSKHQHCPTKKFKYIVNGETANNIACSDNPMDTPKETNACALKGYSGVQGKPILPRCYNDEIAQDSNGKKFTCIENSKIGNINKFIMQDDMRCDEYDTTSNGYMYNINTNKGIKEYQ